MNKRLASAMLEDCADEAYTEAAFLPVNRKIG